MNFETFGGLMMKVYKDGVEANADKAQWRALRAAGWSRSPEKEENEVSPKKEENEVSPKKIVPKTKRKPIAKKSTSKE